MSSSQDESTLSMFTSIVDSAVSARLSFTRGSVPESIGVLQDVEQMARHLEKWLADHHRVQRSHTNGYDEAGQEVSLSPVGKNNPERQQEQQQQHGRSSIFPHSPIAPISPTPRFEPVSNTQHSSFQKQSSPGPNSTATAVEGGAGAGKGGQRYFSGSISGSVSRPGSRSGSETSSAFMPASSTSTSITSATSATVAPSLERGSEGPLSLSASGSGKGYQHYSKAGSEAHDSLLVSAPRSSPASGAAPLTGHSTSRPYLHEGTAADDDSRRYPYHSHRTSSSSALGYSGRGGPLQEHGDSNIEESSSSAGEAGPIVSRQRHTSLPQVLSHQSPNYPHPHHPHSQHPPPEGLQQPTAAGYSLNPHNRRPPSPPQYHYPHSSHHTPGASMTSTSSTSSTSSSSTSYFGLQSASRVLQQRQYEQPGTSGSGSSSNNGAQTPYSMYYHPEHYRARSPSSPSSHGYPYEGHPHHFHHPHGPYSHPYHHPDRVPPPPPHRSTDEWYDERSSYHHQGHSHHYDATDRYQPPYPPPRLYTPPHHLQNHHHHHQDRRHLTPLPIRHHSRFPRRMSQPLTAPGGGSDPESRHIAFVNADLHEQDISDPYVKQLANSDDRLPSSPPPVPQPRNLGPSNTSTMANLASSSSVTTTGASGSGSTLGSQSTGTTSGNNGMNLPVRGGPSTAFGGLVTNASGAPTAAIPGLVFSSRGDNTGSRTQFHAPLEPEVVAKLDDIFFKFLQRICSDLKACDAKGDHIHQPLMAKKMERLEASTEFRPFKFRIQAFTNAFHDSLIQHGLTEDVLPLRKVKLYLWKHRYISRFNEDGKKQKSKGNHVWNIEARKISNVVHISEPASGSGTEGLGASATPSVATPSTSSAASTPSIKASTTTTGFYDLLPLDMDPKHIGPEAISAAGGGLGIIRRPTSPVRWEFREYTGRIAGQIIKYARVGVPYVYSPRIWDAQMSCPAAKFSSPWLPSWLKWHRGELKGIPSAEDKSCTILVVAEYVREGEECRLEMSFPLTVCDPSNEMQELHEPSGVSAEDDGNAGGLYEGSGDSAGAVDLAPSAGHGQGSADSSKMQTEEFSALRQRQSRRKNDGDEEMMMAMKEDEDMKGEMEQEHREQASSYNQHQHPYYNNYSSFHHDHQNLQLPQHDLQAISPRQQEHQREQRQAQQRLQRLHLQEYHQHQQQHGEEDRKPSLFQPTTAPSSVGTTASFYMNPPSSRGSISSSNGSSAYVGEEESDEEEESGDDGDDNESDGDDEEDEEGRTGKTRKMKTRASTRTTTSTSGTRRGRLLSQRQKPSRDQRSIVPQETNKRRKHD